MTTPTHTLEPCPFCKATPHKGFGKVERCQLHGEPFQRFSIWCPHGCAKITRPNADIAHQDWNRRAPDKALVEVLEAVEAAMISGGDGRILDVGWNITKLNEARPLIHAQLTKARSLPHEQH